MVRRGFAVFVFLLVLPCALWAQDSWPLIAKGEYEKAKTAFFQRIKSNPHDRYSWEGLRYLGFALGDDTLSRRAADTLWKYHPTVLEYALDQRLLDLPADSVLRTDLLPSPFQTEAKLWRADSLYARKKFVDATALEQQHFRRPFWWVAGPFYNHTGSAYLETLPGELAPVDEKNWVMPERTLPRYLTFPDHLPYRSEGNAYLAVQFVELSAKTPTVLYLGRSLPIKVWVDGQLVFSDSLPRNFEWDGEQVFLELSQGRHEIRVKVSEYPGRFEGQSSIRASYQQFPGQSPGACGFSLRLESMDGQDANWYNSKTNLDRVTGKVGNVGALPSLLDYEVGDPDNLNNWYVDFQWVALHLQAGRPQDVEEAIHRLHTEMPKDVVYRHLLAEIYLALGREKEADKLLAPLKGKVALRILEQPTLGGLRIGLAKVEEPKSGWINRQRERLRLKKVWDPVRWYAIASHHTERQNYARADKILGKLVAHSHHPQPFLPLWIDNADRRGKTGEALRRSEEALKIGPHDAALLIQKAQLHEKAQQGKEAIEAYHLAQVYAVDPTYQRTAEAARVRLGDLPGPPTWAKLKPLTCATPPASDWYIATDEFSIEVNQAGELIELRELVLVARTPRGASQLWQQGLPQLPEGTLVSRSEQGEAQSWPEALKGDNDPFAAGDSLWLFWEESVRSFAPLPEGWRVDHTLLPEVPTCAARVTLTHPESLPLSNGLQHFGQVNTDASRGWERITWELDEPFLPTWELLAPTETSALSGLRLSGLTTETQVGDWYAKEMYGKLSTHFRLHAQADSLIGDAKTPRAEAEALFEAVRSQYQPTVGTVGQHAYQPRHPLVTAPSGWGDCKDLSALLVSLLRCRDIEAFPVLVRSTRSGPTVPVGLWYDHLIVGAVVGKDTVFLDPTDRAAAFGELPEWDQGQPALVIGDTHSVPVQLPRPTIAQTRLMVEGTGRVQENGDIAWNLRLTLPVELSIRLRTRIEQSPLTTEQALWQGLPELITRALDQPEVRILNLRTKSEPLKVELVARSPATVFTLQGRPYAALAPPLSGLDKEKIEPLTRTQALDLSSLYPPVPIIQRVTLVYPPGTSLPSRIDPILVRSKFGGYESHFVIRGLSVEIENYRHVNAWTVSAKDYPALREFLFTIRSHDRRSISVR